MIEGLCSTFNYPPKGACEVFLHQDFTGERCPPASHNHLFGGRREIGRGSRHEVRVLDRNGVAVLGKFNRGLENAGEIHVSVSFQQRQPSAARPGHHTRPDANLIRPWRRVSLKYRPIRTRAHVVQHAPRLLFGAIHD